MNQLILSNDELKLIHKSLIMRYQSLLFQSIETPKEEHNSPHHRAILDEMMLCDELTIKIYQKEELK